ncbi:hypothetical protein M433DRAFT_152391 [Acidomyces richmondensis BFW]|nr:MAG: hypothetical protein FE78DRAFT_87507 [Acidomyces sp. 'richmondensis']KYG47328.1 hypothetical protein M433DRAFT_152391 [Acidomyces richmondensis BFW]
MRAQVLEAFNKPYVFKDIPKPDTLEGKDILVEVEAASYCHTDAVFASGLMWKDLPRVGSHEFAGKIVGLGPDVDSSLGLKIGMRVGVPGRAYRPCGSCLECKYNDGDPKGYGIWCPKAGNLGLSRNGGFEEFALADSRQVAPIPNGLTSLETAPLMCAGVTIWNALEVAGVNTAGGDNRELIVAIVGAGGGLGHLGVQFAAKLGCKVIAVETSEKALTLLREIVEGLGEKGSQVTIVDARTERAEDVRFAVSGMPETSLEGERGANASIILPESQQALEFGMKVLRNHSTCVAVSFPIEGFCIQPRDLVFRHISMVGVLVGRNHQLRAMLQFAASHNVRAKIVTYPLEQLNQLVEDYHHGASGKLVVDMKKR